MKRTLFLLSALFFIAVGPVRLFAAENEKAAAAPSEVSQQEVQYKKSMEERMAKLGKELDELKAKANAMTAQARKDVSKYLADAEKKRKAAMRKLDEMKTESAHKWNKFTKEMNEAADDFEKAFERAKSHFKE